VTDPSHFRSSREFSSWLGLTPRQNSSGGKERLGRVSKMGNGYLIMTLCSLIARVSPQENINFLLANRIPRQLATRFIGWFS
jgi:transposase